MAQDSASRRADGEDAEPLWRYANVGRLMFNAARRFEQTIHDTVRAHGFPDIRFVHLTLTRNMDARGTRLTDLAARAGMTKQAMGQLVDQCEGLGIVTRRVDPADRRARLVMFTRRGQELLRLLQDGIARAESDLAAEIGQRAYAQLADSLRRYTGAPGKGMT